MAYLIPCVHNVRRRGVRNSDSDNYIPLRNLPRCGHLDGIQLQWMDKGRAVARKVWLKETFCKHFKPDLPLLYDMQQNMLYLLS